jgi:hypothetical protein
MLGFNLCKRAAVTIAGIELLHRIRIGQFCLVRMHQDQSAFATGARYAPHDALSLHAFCACFLRFAPEPFCLFVYVRANLKGE